MLNIFFSFLSSTFLFYFSWNITVHNTPATLKIVYEMNHIIYELSLLQFLCAVCILRFPLSHIFVSVGVMSLSSTWSTA